MDPKNPENDDQSQFNVQADVSDQTPIEAVVRPYDLAVQDRIVRSRMPTLEMINERFSRYVKSGLFDMVRSAVELEFQGLEILKHGDYMGQLDNPTFVCMTKASPLRGTALVCMGTGLIFRVVDKFFGGAGVQAQEMVRDFTEAEHRLVRKTLGHIYQGLEEAWRPVDDFNFEFVGTETNPTMVNVINPTDALVVARFVVNIEGEKEWMHIAYPYSMLEPIRDILIYGFQDSNEERDERWQAALGEEIRRAPMEVNVRLAEKMMTLKDIVAFEEGDILPIKIDDFFKFEMAGVPVFECKLGASKGQVAVKIGNRYKG